jgi:peroxiredoxin family protein
MGEIYTEKGQNIDCIFKMVGMDLQKDSSILINEFVKNAVIQGEATLEGNYKKGNKASDKLFKIIDIMKQDINLAENMLDVLMESQEPNVKIWACSTALDIEYKSKEAEQILKDISNSPDLGILSFNAEMSLEVRKGET